MINVDKKKVFFIIKTNNVMPKNGSLIGMLHPKNDLKYQSYIANFGLGLIINFRR